MQQGRSQTLSATVHARLRQEILDGTLQPGGKLRIGLVAARYGVTSTPVREALNQLASEGFVCRWAQRGFTVAGASLSELEQLTETRCWVEEVALRHSMLHPTPAWEEGILLALHRLSRTARSTEAETFRENQVWEGLHRTFHAALLAACPSRFLLEFCTGLRDHATRYRRLAMRAAYPNRDIGAEHRAIADAVLAGDADTAVDALTTHYRRTARIVAASGHNQTARNS